jgi:homoserine O-acetyltransferase
MDDFMSSDGYFSVMDPNDLLCMAWKWQRRVSLHTGGDLRAALGRIKVRPLLCRCPQICSSAGRLPDQWRLIPDAEFRPIEPSMGISRCSALIPPQPARQAPK